MQQVFLESSFPASQQISIASKRFAPCKAVISICRFIACLLKYSLKRLKKNHLPILATTLSQNSKDYRELARLEDFALVMGNEGQGISPFMADQADQLVHISMKGQAESLNVAIAAGILMFYLS